MNARVPKLRSAEIVDVEFVDQLVPRNAQLELLEADLPVAIEIGRLDPLGDGVLNGNIY